MQSLKIFEKIFIKIKFKLKNFGQEIIKIKL